MLNQYAVELPTLPVDQCHSPPHPIPEGMLSRSIEMPSRREGPPSIWDTHGLSGNVFANSVASSSATYPQELIHGVPEQKNRFTHPQWKRVREKHKFKIRDASLDSQPKILSSSVEEALQRIMWQTNNDCRSQFFILTNSPSRARLRYVLVHTFLRKLCIGSKKWRWLIQWMI